MKGSMCVVTGIGKKERAFFLDWPTRLQIALQAAQGKGAYANAIDITSMEPIFV